MTTMISAALRHLAAFALVIASTAVLSGFAPVNADTQPHPDLAGLTDRLDHDEPLIMSAYGVPGSAVAVVRDGEVVWSTGYGVASSEDGTSMTADTVFQVASISKLVTAWGVMHLVETGQISLDAPIEDYLTRWELPPSAFDSRGVTVARVLSHTAGLNRVDGYALPDDRPLPTIEESLSGDNGGGQSLRIDTEPGQQFLYSNAGYTLLQLMIEEVSGQRFSDYMQENILDPLGMISSTYDPDRVSDQATGHWPSGEPVPHYRLTEQAAGGLYSTANDLALVLAASMPGPDGESIGRDVLTAASVEAMTARREAPDGSLVSYGHLNDDVGDGLTVTGNNGRNVGWITNMVMIPQLGEGIVVLTNSYTESTGITLRSWTQWLGVSDTSFTQHTAGDLDETSNILLGIVGVALGAVIALFAVTAIQARRGKRRWAWQGGQLTGRGIGIRIAIAVIAVALVVAFMLWPERLQYELLLPTEAGLVTAALALATVAVGLRLATRKASK